jgi:hypothetical protein
VVVTITETRAVTAPSAAVSQSAARRAGAVRAGVLQPRVSVIISTLNEARNLPHVLAARPGGLHEVIVDGHSAGAAPDAARELMPPAPASPRCAAWATRPSGRWRPSCTGPGTPACATGATRSGRPPSPRSASSPTATPRWGDGFAIETILSLRASAAGLAVTGVPSFEHARIRGESNLNTFRDGRRFLKTILTEWRNR